MRPNPLVEDLPSALKLKEDEILNNDEKIIIRLKGAYKEALICTNKRIIIIKTGFMTGQTFGSNTFQLPYKSIATAEVKYKMLSGYFEISAGGMQNTEKKFWSSNSSNSPVKAPNCISLDSKIQASKFREACSVIMDMVHGLQKSRTEASTQPDASEDLVSKIERLWALKEAGAISTEEFNAAKAKLISS
ncbi:PH domain-containing protein [Acetobacter pasteurianus]|uniref:PH domain-containing protein n=1 Tax=Acetobacter pasteurianus TaxID=438 RepID=UPI003D0E90B5